MQTSKTDSTIKEVKHGHKKQGNMINKTNMPNLKYIKKCNINSLNQTWSLHDNIKHLTYDHKSIIMNIIETLKSNMNQR